MMLNKTNVCLGAVLIFLGACAAPKPGTPEFVQKKEDEQQKASTQAAESSPDLQRSMDKAVMAAKSQLASKLGDRTSQKIRDFANETGAINDEQIVRVIETTRISIANDINVAGYVLEKSSVIQEGNRYRSFVLLRYPLGESNKVVVAQVKKDSAVEAKLKASKAFEDLEREIEAAKKK